MTVNLPTEQTKPASVFNLPNNLTIARIVMIPLFVAIAYWPPALGIGVPAIPDNAIARLGMMEYSDSMLRHLILTLLFVLAALTDWLDGHLARKMNITSAFGRFLDPVADKLMVAAALIVLVQWHPIIVMATSAIVIISREIVVSALREWMAQIGASKSVAVHMLGKLKTTVQMVAIPLLLYDGHLFDIIDTSVWGTWLIWIAAVLTVWSMVYYLQKALPEIRARVAK